ncbi:protein of unknown function [Vibrio tapetis subsp. tapetis]|uniref:Uncharacterized protein n=1 Tax=Vibrio tapetis subsp. tapetis TaxID=1671868 RepID=A0A2N8ZCF6_9VIBR|nr:protein of unknown function [Vibrio tapetis subsp. tapetis]
MRFLVFEHDFSPQHAIINSKLLRQNLTYHPYFIVNTYGK